MAWLKDIARGNLELQEEILQMLLENLEEESILENDGDDSSQCLFERIYRKLYKEKKKREIIDSIEDDTPGTIVCTPCWGKGGSWNFVILCFWRRTRYKIFLISGEGGVVLSSMGN